MACFGGTGSVAWYDASRSGTAKESKPEINNMNERWLSVEEIAAHLGVNPDTIYKWIERKRMPAHKVGRLWKFLASEVDNWVKTGKAGEDSLPEAQSMPIDKPFRKGDKQ